MDLNVYECPYLHDITDSYCNLFKGYQNCKNKECEVLKLIQEKKKVEEQLKAVLDCRLCMCNGCDNEDCPMVKSEVEE